MLNNIFKGEFQASYKSSVLFFSLKVDSVVKSDAECSSVDKCFTNSAQNCKVPIFFFFFFTNGAPKSKAPQCPPLQKS